MKFERPKDLFDFSKPQKIGDEEFRYNEVAFHRAWEKEYQERIKFLDVALPLEGAVDYFISKVLFDDFIRGYFMVEMILSKIDFDQKITIFESLIYNFEIFKGTISSPLNFEKISDKEIKVDNFYIKLNKLLYEIRLIKDIRNHCVHRHRPIFGKDIIIKESQKKLYEHKTFDKEAVLVKGHFILWLFNLIHKDPFMRLEGFINYYKKYQDILKEIAEYKSR